MVTYRKLYRDARSAKYKILKQPVLLQIPHDADCCFILVFRNCYVAVKRKDFTLYIPLRGTSEEITPQFQFSYRRIHLF